MDGLSRRFLRLFQVVDFASSLEVFPLGAAFPPRGGLWLQVWSFQGSRPAPVPVVPSSIICQAPKGRMYNGLYSCSKKQGSYTCQSRRVLPPAPASTCGVSPPPPAPAVGAHQRLPADSSGSRQTLPPRAVRLPPPPPATTTRTTTTAAGVHHRRPQAR